MAESSASGSDAVAATLRPMVLSAPVRLGRTRLVCVDGPAGSGKTSTAAALEAALQAGGHEVRVVHMDDLYEGWTGLDAALEQRLVDQVVEPLAAGRPGRWQRYDWTRSRFAEWHDLPPPRLLLLEGCGSGALDHSAYVSLLVWVEADRDTRLRRGIERDGPQVEPLWRAWMDREDVHFDRNRTRQRADVRFWTGDGRASYARVDT